MSHRCQETIVRFRDRIAVITRCQHLDVGFEMELVEQIDDGVHRLADGIVPLEVINVMGRSGQVLLRRHSQGDVVVDVNALCPKLIKHLDNSGLGRHWRNNSVDLEVGLVVGDWSDHGSVGLLHRIQEPEWF